MRAIPARLQAEDVAEHGAGAANDDGLAPRSLLRFITCGSVDDGKSTLIGRLLFDTGAVPDDQLGALERDSRRFGTQGAAIDFALLVDGLSAEREQGITIDVAYRYFGTQRRSFIVADTPGHEQYTRNMATGASTAAAGSCGPEAEARGRSADDATGRRPPLCGVLLPLDGGRCAVDIRPQASLCAAELIGRHAHPLKLGGGTAHARLLPFNFVAELVGRRRRLRVRGLQSSTGCLCGHELPRESADNLAVRAVEDAGALDIAQRKQTSFSGISAEAQARNLAPQAKKIAFDTQFSTLDVTKAQTATMAGLPDHLDKAGVAKSLVDQAQNVAMALGSTMEEAAESMRSYLAARVADMSTAEAAERSARSAANRMIRAAKLGGMSAEDVAQFTKYGGASARAAGVSEDNTLAFGIALRRAGVRGDEAGVAVRSFSGKLVAPTNKGRAAMLAAGIDHDRFTTMPGGLSTDNLSQTMASQLGMKLNEATRAAIEAIHGDAEVVTDRGKYAAAVAEAIEENAGKKLSAKDTQAIARAATTFHKLSVESVDVNALLEALMTTNLTLAQANAIFTDKQGGRAALALGNSANFASDKKALAETPDDYGAKIAEQIMAGLGGSLERFKGAVEATILSLGEANSGLARFGLEGVGGMLDKFSNMSETARQATTAIGALGAAATGAYGLYRVGGALRALMGGGSAAALSGSALALDGSAAALTAAAVKLGGAGVAGAAGTAATGAGGAAAAASKMGWLARLGIWGAVGGAAYGVGKVINGDAPLRTPESRAAGRALEQRNNPGGSSRAQDDKLKEWLARTQPGAAGADAGAKAGDGIASGVAAAAPKVEAASRGVMDRIRAMFGAGVDMPVRVTPSAAPPAAPSPQKQSSLAPSIRNNITVTTGSGDPREIAAAISKQVGEKTAESLRGVFADGATA